LQQPVWPADTEAPGETQHVASSMEAHLFPPTIADMQCTDRRMTVPAARSEAATTRIQPRQFFDLSVNGSAMVLLDCACIAALTGQA
jgi:hypothetical protein